MELEHLNMRVGNLELRTCDTHLISTGPHTRAEIVQWWNKEDSDEQSCFTLACWQRGKEGFDLHFVGPRPFGEGVDRGRFMQLAEIGQKHLDEYFASQEEEDEA